VSSNVAGEATRERLLNAAERLVAKRGVSGVSTREILMDAGADSAAIHYHFGSKDGLMTAVYRRRLHVHAEGAQRVLEAKTATGATLTARDLAEAIVLPIAELAEDEGGGRHYLGFVMALLHYPPLAHLRADSDAWMKVVLAAYKEVAPKLSTLDRRRRIGFASFAAMGALSGGPINVWYDRHMQKPGVMAAALIDFISSGLASEGA
jgi:AcrR family transcriptional regulator